MKEKIRSIVVDADIYPRHQKSEKTITTYKDAIEAGAQFPPIEVQKVIEDGKEFIALLDGLHRLEAHKASGEKEIPVVYWKAEAIDKAENINELRLRAATLNIQHGDRLSKDDRKEVARTIANNDKDVKITEERMANELGVTQQTINNWIKDIRAKQRAGRNNIIWRLRLLGFSGDVISDILDNQVSKSQVYEISDNTNFSKIGQSINEYIEKGDSIEELAGKLYIDHTLAWAIHLNGKPDDERLSKLQIEPKRFTAWNFTGCSPLMGKSDFNGRIPGEFPLNFMYWFTKQDDLVVDPMAGGGITLDAALLMQRKCRSFDISPSREEIEKHDITQGYPELKKKPNAVFCDPPYWSAVDYGGGLSSYPLEEYYEAMKKFIHDTYDVLQAGGTFGLIMANQSTRIAIKEGRLTDKYGHRLEHILTMYNYCIDAGFKPHWRINCPLSNHNAQDWARGEWELGRLGELNRELLVFKK